MGKKNREAAFELLPSLRRSELSPTTKLLLIVIADSVPDGRRLAMRQATLAERTGVSVASVERGLAELQAIGLLEFDGYKSHALKTYQLPPVREVFGWPRGNRRTNQRLLWEFAVKRADSAPEDRTVRLSRSRNKVLAFDYTWLDDPMEERF